MGESVDILAFFFCFKSAILDFIIIFVYWPFNCIASIMYFAKIISVTELMFTQCVWLLCLGFGMG